MVRALHKLPNIALFILLSGTWFITRCFKSENHLIIVYCAPRAKNGLNYSLNLNQSNFH